MEEQKKIVLPTEVRKATHVNPRDIIIYGKPKVGKTTALSMLPNILLIDLEKGAAFIDGMVIEPPDNMGPVGKWQWLKQLAKTIIDEGRPYDYVAIDTLTQLDTDAEWVATYQYMNTIIGKKFNRDDSGNMLKPDNPNYESVHTLANGAGYRYSREAIIDMYNTLRYLGKVCTIFVCHVADKMIAEKNGEQIMTKDLALTGKVKDILARAPDALANVWNEDGQLMISFAGNGDKIGGMRGNHIKGYIGKLDWSKVFIENK
jgi:hypothetical protein